MKLTRDKIQRMIDAGGRSASSSGPSAVIDMTGYATESWAEGNFVSKAYFNKLFRVHGTKTVTDEETGESSTTSVVVAPNDTDTQMTDIEAMLGVWTNEYLSALGRNSESGGGGSGGSATLAGLIDVALQNPASGQGLVYDAAQGKWVNRALFRQLDFANSMLTVTVGSTTRSVQIPTSGGTVTSVGLTVPDGFAAGDAVTGAGSLTFWPDGTVATGLNADMVDGCHADDMMQRRNAGTYPILANLQSAGSYFLGGGTSYYYGNTPDDSIDFDYGQLLVVRGQGADTMAQLLFPYNQTTAFLRVGNPASDTGQWQSWRRFLFADDAIGASTLGGRSLVVPYSSSSGTKGQYAGRIPYIGSDYVIDIGRYIDLHRANDYLDYVTRLQLDSGANGNIVTLPSGSGTLALTSDTVAKAERLAGTASHTAWGQTYWQVGQPQDISGADLFLNENGLGMYLAGNGHAIAWHNKKSWVYTLFDIVDGGTSGTIETHQLLRARSNVEVVDGGSIYSDQVVYSGRSGNYAGGFSGLSSVSGSHDTQYGIYSGSGAMVNDGSVVVGMLSMVHNGNFAGTMGMGLDAQSGYHVYFSCWGQRTTSGTVQTRVRLTEPAIEIGDCVLYWDASNNALRVQRRDGAAANLYTTGGVSAIGMMPGVSMIQSMTFGYITINNRLTMGAGATIAQASGHLVIGNVSDQTTGHVKIAQLMESQQQDTSGTTYWQIKPNGEARFKRLYLDGTRYLYLNGSTLMFYNGSQYKTIAFT